MSNNATEHTAAYKVFKFYIDVQIPQHHLYNQDYIKEFGVPTTGDHKVDSALSKSMVNARMTIAQLAELLAEGSPIVLVDPEKSVFIYETIVEHLNNWRSKLESGFVGNNVPMEDLNKLDQLANEVYPLAKGFMDKTPSDSITSVLGMGSVNTSIRRARRRNEQNQLEAPPPKQEGYVSIAENISKEVFRQSKGR